MKYLIKPYKGINDFIFGSSIESIQKKYNVPFKTIQKKEITKLFSEDLSFTFENNQLMEISVIETMVLNCALMDIVYFKIIILFRNCKRLIQVL